MKYLGVYLDSKLCWNVHLDYVVKKVNGCIASLYPLLCRKSKLNIRNKLTIYLTIIRPVMTYASVSWAYSSDKHINILQVVQNKILRMITNSPWFVRNSQLHCDLNVEYLKSLF